MLSVTHNYLTCGEQCCLHINKKGLWCDQSHLTKAVVGKAALISNRWFER